MTIKQPLALAISKGSTLSEADFNALDELKTGLEGRDRVLTIVSHKDAPELSSVRVWTERQKQELPLVILQPADKEGLGRLALRQADDQLPRLVALKAEACVELEGGGKIAEECRAADLPIFTFTAK